MTDIANNTSDNDEMQPKYQPNFSYFNKRDIKTMAIMVAPVVFILTVGIYFHEFVWHAIAVNVSINLGIISAAAFGVFLILVRLVAVQHDFRIIERFGYEAKQGTYMKTLLEQPWLRNRYVRHYLSHIANTGGTLSTQLEHSAIESELHALQTDYDSRLELPQFIVGFMIAMGLLGTFIGLLETLTGISGMLDHMSGSGDDVQKQFMELVVELRKPLAGMGIAFSASMFGLITSLMLAIMMINLRRYVSRTISLARNVMHELTEMSRDRSERKGGISNLSPNDVKALLAAESGGLLPTASEAIVEEENKADNDDARQQMFAGGGGSGGGYGVGLDPAMAGRFDLMTKKIELLLEVIADNTENARRLNDLIGFGPRMKEISEKTLEEIKILSSRGTDQRHMLENLANKIEESSQIAIGNGRHLHEIKENFTKMGKNTGFVELIASNIGGHTALLEAIVEEIRRSQQGLAIINRSIQDRKTGS